MGVLAIIIACVLSAILYRMGGSGKYDTLWRDIGCPLVLIGLTLILFGVAEAWWCYLICFGLSWGALTTYWDWLFGYDNFYAHGFGCSLATIPLYWVGVPWQVLAVHAVVCTLGMGLWSKWTKDAVVEECGRGVFFIL